MTCQRPPRLAPNSQTEAPPPRPRPRARLQGVYRGRRVGLDSPWALLRGVTWAAGLGAGTPAPALRWEGAESPRQLLLQTGHAAAQPVRSAGRWPLIWRCRLRASQGCGWWTPPGPQSSPAVVPAPCCPWGGARPSGLWRGAGALRKTRASLPSPLRALSSQTLVLRRLRPDVEGMPVALLHPQVTAPAGRN